MSEKIPASYEFRTFWWRGQLVGAGPYLGVELAKREDGTWIIIEVMTPRTAVTPGSSLSRFSGG